MSQQITTSKVRLSYVSVFSPKQTPQGSMKYSVTCLLPKADTAGYKIITDAIAREVQAEQQGKLNGVTVPKTPLHDGDGVKSDGTPYGPECKSCWVFTASAGEEYQPQVFDRNVQPLLDKTKLYSGCYGNVALSVYAYNNQSKGIGFGLNAVQVVEDGEPLGYSFDASKAFTAQQTAGDVDPLTGLPR